MSNLPEVTHVYSLHTAGPFCLMLLPQMMTNHITVCAKWKEMLLGNYKHYANLHSTIQCKMDDDGYVGICV